jgi:diguanylate cyclase (GGDEF)-like protein
MKKQNSNGEGSLLDRETVYRIVMIGMGKGGSKLAHIFSEDPTLKIIGVSNRNQDVPGIKWAKSQGIFATNDYKELLKLPKIDVVMDASGNPEVATHLGTLGNHVEVVSGMTANLIWRLVDEREAREKESTRNLNGQRRLYDIGLRLANTEKSESALKFIIEAGMEILGMSAGSAALFDEERGEMKIASSIGFKGEQTMEKLEWKVKPGGLTSHILSTHGPTIIENVNSDHSFDTERLKSQGIGSLIAVPLVADGRIVGILYVDDFKPRTFSEYDVNLMSLLGTLAASAVDKVLMLERAEHMAITDELTKVFNHRYFSRTLSTELKRAGRYGETMGVCMIDVDHFKKFNDTHGHLKGNEVLICIANLLKQQARETDIVARYGGEEFVVILPKTNKKHAMQLAERLRAAVENQEIHGRETQPLGKLTISVGVAVFPEDFNNPDDPATFLGIADAAMYISKQHGRNRVTAHHEL